MITIFKKRNLNFPSLTLKTSHERGLPGNPKAQRDLKKINNPLVKCANQEFLRILLGSACAKSSWLPARRALADGDFPAPFLASPFWVSKRVKLPVGLFVVI